jgi:hypothetical protein
MAVDKNAARAWRAKLRNVLNFVWDPIGGCPPDEYDSYNGKIAAMIREGADDEALLAYLHWGRTENIGMIGNRERDAETLAAIRKLGPPP